jgi:hypothetical protein
MYDNQSRLRTLAKQALQQKGFVITETGVAGSRLKAVKSGEAFRILVRTSSDRWVGWMRKDGEWRGISDADFVIVAALDGAKKSKSAWVYAFEPEDVQSALTENLEAREANSDFSKTAPVFVCLDHKESRPAGVASNLRAKALWHVEVPLDEVVQPPPASESVRETFARRVKQEFADLMGVPVESVSVEFRVNL